ncbi:glucosaminidase domain-containing protein [Candidatus Woesebacteria bacterium]|nr:glucosaminidase domain-containing protein [Candidatus Woesebacteria bacterium]
MKRIISLILITTLLFIVPTAHATQEAGTSASLMANEVQNQEVMLKKLVVREFLAQHNSPMLAHADDFVDISLKYGLNPYLLPSISGVESTFGRFLMPNSYNPFGWGGGYIYFDSWNDGIETVSSGLHKNYLGKGAISIEQIGHIYSESPRWSRNVRYFMNQMNALEQEKRLYFSQLAVEL